MGACKEKEGREKGRTRAGAVKREGRSGTEGKFRRLSATDQLQTIPRDRHRIRVTGRKKERKKNGGEMETIKRHRRCKDMKVS